MDDVRLIDANIVMSKLKAEVDNIPKRTNYPIGIADGISYAMATIDCAPTVDAQPVKHGEWVDIGRLQGLKCSNCGKRASYKNGTPCLDVYWAFCPACGSDNRGDAE